MDIFLDFFREVASQLAQIGVFLVRVVISFGTAWLISRLARQQIEPRIAKQKHGRDGALLIGRLISIFAYGLAFISIMNQMDVNWTGILTLLSAFTVAVGLSLQDVIRNFFSGIFLLLERPFSVGDRVKVRDIEGEIQGIDVRTTLIRNHDGALIHVPNSIMFGDTLTNRSHFRTKRFQVAITDPKRTVEEIEQTVRACLTPLKDVRKPIGNPEVISVSPDGVVVHYSFLVNVDPGVNRDVMLILAGSLEGATIEVTP